MMTTVRNFARDFAIALVAGAVFGVGVLSWLDSKPAHAGPERILAGAAHDAVTAVGPGFSDSFSVTCASTATLIRASGQISYTCQVPGTTAVYVGDAGLSTTTAPSYCATNCPEQVFGGNVRQEYCLVASGTVDVKCRAMVGQEP